jgi:hypothetical protein
MWRVAPARRGRRPRLTDAEARSRSSYGCVGAPYPARAGPASRTTPGSAVGSSRSRRPAPVQVTSRDLAATASRTADRAGGHRPARPRDPRPPTTTMQGTDADNSRPLISGSGARAPDLSLSHQFWRSSRDRRPDRAHGHHPAAPGPARRTGPAQRPRRRPTVDRVDLRHPQGPARLERHSGPTSQGVGTA